MAGFDDLELIMDRNLHRAFAASRTHTPSSSSQVNSAAAEEDVPDAVLEDEDQDEVDVAGMRVLEIFFKFVASFLFFFSLLCGEDCFNSDGIACLCFFGIAGIVLTLYL
jgi:hypothetical protein